MLNDQAFLRYSRQMLLEEIGPEGQERLSAATVLIVGLGGLGSPASHAGAGR
jgi:sulfur carrier protein ThiS adenylyltransferase